jgi:hypothetical protein
LNQEFLTSLVLEKKLVRRYEIVDRIHRFLMATHPTANPII